MATEMGLEGGKLGVEVLSAAYSYHTKPFHMTEKDGFQTHYLIRIQTEGVSRTRIDGQLATVEPGDLLLVPPTMPYELLIDDGGGRAAASGDYYIFFRGPWVDDWWRERNRPMKVKIPLDEGLLPLCRQLIAEHRRGAGDSLRVLDYMMRAICLTIDRLSSEQRPMQGNALLAYRMKSYIEEHATARFHLKDLARHCNVSVSRAVHLYKQFFNKSIIQYALEIRLKVAQERMVYTQTPLEAIAETSGFPSYTYFYRAFKKATGMSPKQYRSRHGGCFQTDLE